MIDKQKLKFISLGCAKALVDSEKLMGALKNTNYQITEEPEEADTMVINTCGFIDVARQESVDTILQASELKQSGKLDKLVVMGCLSERYPEELSKEIPEVDYFFGSNDHVKIIQYLTGKEFSKDDPIFLRSILTPDHYAYIKIAEGCDNGCSFCSIPIMRGLQKSRTIDSIMWVSEKLSERGVRELLVIAQDTTSYGWDLKPKQYLGNLIKELDQLDFEWIRIHYAHPAHLSKKIISAIADAKNICNYIHLPVQSGSDRVLESMNRQHTRADYIELIKNIRNILPDCGISQDIISGFPSETEEDHQDTLSLMEYVKYDFGFMFMYSERPGTPAAKKLDDNIPDDVKKQRLKEVVALQQQHGLYRTQQFVGQIVEVLIEKESKKSKKHWSGRNQQNTVVVFPKENFKVGDFVNVKIEDCTSATLIGKAV